jgi:RNA polymerase sigma factor (sigma-70 family)
MLDWLRRDDWIPRLERARFKREGIVGPTRMVSLDEKIAATSDGDRDIMRRDFLEARRDFLEADQKAPEHDTELADFWSSPLPWVSARDWRVLQMYYRDGMAMREIGAIIGCCESNVWRIIEKIRLAAS